MKEIKTCPKCGYQMAFYKNPYPTVDIIIYTPEGQVVLIERKNSPKGWALPGGFVDYGESVEEAAKREAREEIGVEVELEALLGVYSSPDRDPRHHTITVVFMAPLLDGSLIKAGDDAQNASLFSLDSLPTMAFDHKRILEDFKKRMEGEIIENPVSTGASRCI